MPFGFLQRGSLAEHAKQMKLGQYVPEIKLEGLPVGVQLVADNGREDVLIRVSSQLEAAKPRSGKHPPIYSRLRKLT